MSFPFDFRPFEIPAEFCTLRQEVRAFLRDAAREWTGWRIGQSWTGFNREFSKEVGRRGWIGMTWPRQYGGQERSEIERYVVLEEMLTVGAPVGAHWIADRQSGPLLLRLGTQAQRERFLPGCARGELAFCIGLSEPDSGSDLASLRSRALRVKNGWRLNGRKIWTTNAQNCDLMIGLFRSDPSAEKHKGLSQFLIDMHAPGIDVRPIRDLTGEAHFNEVTFDDVFVPGEMLVGVEGEGWAQATAELTFERSQPDRYMSAFPLFSALINTLRKESAADRLACRRIGETYAELVLLRQMSLSIAGRLAAGESPAQEAVLLKDLGNTHEQGIPDLARELLDVPSTIDRQDMLSELQAVLTEISPMFSLRGGTREILRGIIAKGLGLR
jgi:alkylation response protein AidB-like acyl-CoA dehydrogenase